MCRSAGQSVFDVRGQPPRSLAACHAFSSRRRTKFGPLPLKSRKGGEREREREREKVGQLSSKECRISCSCPCPAAPAPTARSTARSPADSRPHVLLLCTSRRSLGRRRRRWPKRMCIRSEEDGRTDGRGRTVTDRDRRSGDPPEETNEPSERENRCHKRPVKISWQMGPLAAPPSILAPARSSAKMGSSRACSPVAPTEGGQSEFITPSSFNTLPSAAYLTSPSVCLSYSATAQQVWTRHSLVRGRGNANGSATKTRSNFTAPVGL